VEIHAHLVHTIRRLAAHTMRGSDLGTVIATNCKRLQEVLMYGSKANTPFPPSDASSTHLRNYAIAVVGVIDTAHRYNRAKKLVLPFLQKCTDAGVFVAVPVNDTPTLPQLHQHMSLCVSPQHKGSKVMTDATVQQLLDVCRTAEEKLFVTLSATTGLRARAVSLLRLGDVYDPVKRTVLDQFAIREKGGKIRQIWPGDKLKGCIEMYVRTIQPDAKAFLFGNRRNRGEGSPYFAGNCMRSLCRRAALPRYLGHHTFRAYVVHSCLEHGMDIDTVSQWLGHSSTRLTYEHYWFRGGVSKLGTNIPRDEVLFLCNTFGFAPP
jgi:integrase